MIGAWPPLAATALLLLGSAVLVARSSAAGPSDLDALLPVAESVGAPWIALAVLATAVSLLLSRRLADERF